MLLGDIIALNARRSAGARSRSSTASGRSPTAELHEQRHPAGQRPARRGRAGRPHRDPRREPRRVRRVLLRRAGRRDGAHLPELPAPPEGVGVDPRTTPRRGVLHRRARRTSSRSSRCSAEVPVVRARHRHRRRGRRRRRASTTTTSWRRHATTAPPVEVDEDDTAWLIYTSGTTGFPKGAMLTHRNLVTAVLESVIEYQPQPDERNLLAFPLCHVAGLHRAAHPPARRARGADAGLRARAVHAARRASTASPARPGTDDAQLPPPAPEDRRVRPVDAAQHRLRRGGHAGRGAQGRDRALRPDRVLRLRDDRARRQRAEFTRRRPTSGPSTARSTCWPSCGTPMCLADVKVVDETWTSARPVSSARS